VDCCPIYVVVLTLQQPRPQQRARTCTWLAVRNELKLVLVVQAIKATGATYLEAPVSGSKQPAEKGQLIFLCGGDKDLYEEATPLLKVMGKAQFFLGEVGACTPGLAPPCAGTEPCKMNSTLASPNPGLVSPNHSWPQLSQ